MEDKSDHAVMLAELTRILLRSDGSMPPDVDWSPNQFAAWSTVFQCAWMGSRLIDLSNAGVSVDASLMDLAVKAVDDARRVVEIFDLKVGRSC